MKRKQLDMDNSACTQVDDDEELEKRFCDKRRFRNGNWPDSDRNEEAVFSVDVDVVSSLCPLSR